MKRTIWLMCASLCAATMVPVVPTLLTAQAQAPQTGRINADAVRARASADLASPIVFSPAKDAVVQVLAREGVWSRIQLGDKLGYVRTSVITMTSAAAPAASAPVASAQPTTQPSTTPPRSSTPPRTQTPPAGATATAAPPATSTASAAEPPASPPTTSTPPASRDPATAAPRQEAARETPKTEEKKSESGTTTAGTSSGIPSHLVAAGVSYTPADKAEAGATDVETGAHIAGHLILQLSKGPIGVLGVGGMGNGTGYKSQFANAALSVALLRAGKLRFDVLGGGAYYTEKLDGGVAEKADAATGAMAGAMLTLPIVGPLRGTVLGSYMIGKWSDSAVLHAGDARFFRIIVGLGF